MKELFDVVIYCASTNHPGRQVFVGGFQYLAHMDTPEMWPHGTYWGVGVGPTKAVMDRASFIKPNNNMNLRLECRKCRRPVLAVRLATIAPVLRNLMNSDVASISLADIAAIVAERTRRET